MRRFGIAFIFMMVAALVAAPWAGAADTVKIGLVTPMSAPGDYKSGQVNTQTVELAAEELNKDGGLLGKKVEIVKADDEGKPAVGVTAMKRLLAGGDVTATVGHWHSSVSVAQAKISDQKKVPMLLHYSWDDALTAGHSEYVWRVGPFNSEIAALMTPFFVKSGYKTVAVMYETTAFGTGFAEALKKNCEAQGIKIYDISYPAEATDLKPQLLELKGKDPAPEVLVIASVYQAMYLIPKQAHEIGLAPACKMMTSWDWTVYPDFWEVNWARRGVGVTLYSDLRVATSWQLSPLGDPASRNPSRPSTTTSRLSSPTSSTTRS